MFEQAELPGYWYRTTDNKTSYFVEKTAFVILVFERWFFSRTFVDTKLLITENSFIYKCRANM